MKSPIVDHFINSAKPPDTMPWLYVVSSLMLLGVPWHGPQGQCKWYVRMVPPTVPKTAVFGKFLYPK